jgi:hypothetical protein
MGIDSGSNVEAVKLLELIGSWKRGSEELKYWKTSETKNLKNNGQNGFEK